MTREQWHALESWDQVPRWQRMALVAAAFAAPPADCLGIEASHPDQPDVKVALHCPRCPAAPSSPLSGGRYSSESTSTSTPANIALSGGERREELERAAKRFLDAWGFDHEVGTPREQSDAAYALDAALQAPAPSVTLTAGGEERKIGGRTEGEWRRDLIMLGGFERFQVNALLMQAFR